MINLPNMLFFKILHLVTNHSRKFIILSTTIDNKARTIVNIQYIPPIYTTEMLYYPNA